MAKNKLSIYLAKESISEIEDLIDMDGVHELFRIDDNSIAYCVPSYTHEPSWAEDFFLRRSDQLQQASSKVVFIKRLNFDNAVRMFALTFGYARFLFKENVLEEQFGLKIVLNSIRQNELRKISKISVGFNQKQTQEQIPKNGDIYEFGFDINRDLMKNVSGKSDEDIFEKSMLTGGDIFSLTVERDITNIEEFLIFCYQKFCQNSYRDRFGWIDNIKAVRNTVTIGTLNQRLLELINSNEYTQVWMAVPEVISWEDVQGFHYSGDSQAFYNDILIEDVVPTIRHLPLTSINQLENKRISAVSSRDPLQNIAEWSAYKCCLAEFSYDGVEYCLNNGNWYSINHDFAQDVNAKYEQLPLFEETLIEYSYRDENEYNAALVQTLDDAEEWHRMNIPLGGGSGNQIEPCDVAWQNYFMHIKKNGGSNYLSHLFNQALVSSRALLDNDFRNRLNVKILNEGFVKTLPAIFNSSNYSIIICIINRYTDARPRIPFFSKVSLDFVAQYIKNFGYSLKLKNIPHA